jgi:hypothetical protein
MMKLTDADLSLLSASPDLSVHAGPSSLASSSDGFVVTNGHTNGFTKMTNGKSEMGAAFTNGVQKHSSSVTRVTLPGTTLYDDSPVDREEFIRLVIQSLRDIGYVSVPLILLFRVPTNWLIEGNRPLRWKRNLDTQWNLRKCRNLDNSSLMACGLKLRLL